MTEKACKDYFDRFPSSLQKSDEIKNEDRIQFMLTNPVIRTKLDEWLLTGNAPAGGKDGSDGYSSTNLPGSSKKKPGLNPTNPEKNHELSLKKRKEGNGFFQKKMLVQSLDCYHEALRHSKFTKGDEGKDAAICLANRSAVYYEMGKLDLALRDADLALANRYPDNLKTKLVLRKANIYLHQGKLNWATRMLKLGREIEASAADTEAGQAPAQTTTTTNIEKLDKLENDILTKGRYGVESNLSQEMDRLAKVRDETETTSFEDNQFFQNASDALGIEFSEKSTRFVTCSRDVKMGETIFQEFPFASVLIPEFYEGYCNFCLKELKDYFFPCSNCTQVSYCSAECCTIAWKEYHSHECQSLQLLQSVGIAHLAIRIVLTAGTKEVLNTLKLKKELNGYHNVKVFQNGERNYSRVFSLMNHIGDMRPEDLFQYSLTASLLTNFLRRRTHFLEGMSEDETARIGGVILHHICQLICNGHAVTSILSDLNVEHISYSTLEETQVKIGTAIYPAVSLVNHSCDPNIACSFRNGRTLIVRTISDLQKDSEILNCYGPSFRRMSRKTRQENLNQQYFFDCDCPPCQKELTENSNFVDKFHAYCCSKCSGPVLRRNNSTPTLLEECLRCHHSQDMKTVVEAVFKSDEFYSEGMENLKQGKVKEALINLLKCYNLRSKALFEDNADLGEVCDALGRCYAIIGDFSKSAEFVRKSLAHVEARFGTSSIEYAREITKYADLLNKLGNTEPNFDGFPSENLIERSKFILKLYTA